MNTKAIVEAMLYQTPEIEKFFKAAHIIDHERNWKAKKHDEFYFLQEFLDPRFIVVISSQVHVYIVGNESRKKNYNIINIEGFNADHLVITKNELIARIKDTVSEKLFLPDNYTDRIIYMYHEVLFIFNRVSNTSKNMFSKSQWSLGSNIYDIDAKTYETSAWQILKAITSEF